MEGNKVDAEPKENKINNKKRRRGVVSVKVKKGGGRGLC